MALADWRRYFYARPVTLAFRGLFFGRYGQDAESPQITPLFLGQRDARAWVLVGVNFEGGECSFTGTGSHQGQCPEFDRLVGSKMGIASVELRLPLLGPQGFGLIPFNFLPLEIAPFADAGFAWTENDHGRFVFDRNAVDRVPVFSYGVTARVNLLGYAVFETYYAFPTHRKKGWHWGFNFVPWVVR